MTLCSANRLLAEVILRKPPPPLRMSLSCLLARALQQSVPGFRLPLLSSTCLYRTLGPCHRESVCLAPAPIACACLLLEPVPRQIKINRALGLVKHARDSPFYLLYPVVSLLPLKTSLFEDSAANSLSFAESGLGAGLNRQEDASSSPRSVYAGGRSRRDSPAAARLAALGNPGGDLLPDLIALTREALLVGPPRNTRWLKQGSTTRRFTAIRHRLEEDPGPRWKPSSGNRRPAPATGRGCGSPSESEPPVSCIAGVFANPWERMTSL
nr:hypothetical protein Iba_chr15aCG12200 [Ipomoea batatas]